jgi:hypothetical protein
MQTSVLRVVDGEDDTEALDLKHFKITMQSASEQKAIKWLSYFAFFWNFNCFEFSHFYMLLEGLLKEMDNFFKEISKVNVEFSHFK